jgi:PncC family amidohydrolase
VSDPVGRVSEILARRQLRLVTAESCTGGLVAQRITDRPGASRFFQAGLVTYSDAAKQSLLGVRQDTLARHGAVSEPVAREMLRGALRLGDAAVAITGIAGPEGGTEEKPVGTVWIGAGFGDVLEVRRYHFPGDRKAVREASADAALALLETLVESAP